MPKIENLIRKILINQNLYQYLILFQKAHGYILTETEHYFLHSPHFVEWHKYLLKDNPPGESHKKVIIH